MKVLVAGAGAVGSWLGAALVAGGSEIVLVARDAHGSAMADRGLTALRNPPLHIRPPVFGSVTEAHALGPFDFAVVAVKSYVTPMLAAEWSQSGAPARVVSFQNGVGNEAILASALPGSTVIAATLTLAVHIPEPGTVTAWHKGGAGLAPPTGGSDVADLASALRAGGIATRLYADGASMKWSKLLLNMIGAASSAAIAWPPPRLLAHRGVFQLELAAWREALAVMRAASLSPVALPDYRVDLFARIGERVPAAALFPFVHRRVGRERGDRLPGVAADVQRGVPHTEVEAMNGAVARTGRELGVATPTNAALAGIVGDIAGGRVPRERFVGRPEALLAEMAARGVRV